MSIFSLIFPLPMMVTATVPAATWRVVHLRNSEAFTDHNAAVNILNLPDYCVLRVGEPDHDYHITAEVSNPPKTCAECQSDRMNGHGRNPRVIRDIPTHGKRVAIYIENQRWRCQACGKTCMEVIPAADEKRDMTQRLVKWVGSQSMMRTFASVAEETGLDEKTIRNIFRNHINVLEAQLNRGRERLSPSPPSEPGVRFSRDGLSSQMFPHRDWRANLWTSDIVNSPRSAKKAFGHCL